MESPKRESLASSGADFIWAGCHSCCHQVVYSQQNGTHSPGASHIDLPIGPHFLWFINYDYTTSFCKPSEVKLKLGNSWLLCFGEMVKCITGSRSSSGRFYYYLEITVQWLTCSFLHFLADVYSYTFEPFIFAVAANVSLETFQLFFWWIELIHLLVIFLVIDSSQNRWKLFLSSVNAVLPSIR